MTFTIGTGGNAVDMIPFVAHKDGFKWQRYDVDDPNTGRTLDGLMHRGRVATKIKLEIKCIPLKATDLATVLNAILPEYVTVTYTDPMLGEVTKTMYSNNNPAVHAEIYPDGTELWDGISFPLVER